jgi:hypothetical protein
MNHHGPDRLLKEFLAGEELSDFRQASLDHSLNIMRRAQRRRRAVRFGALAAVSVAAVLALTLRWADVPVSQPVTESLSAQPGPPPVKFISEQELLALFPGRSLALVGEPGRQQLVFLDDPTPN